MLREELTMRLSNLRSVFVALALGTVTTLLGCGGGATSLDVCYANCDALYRCAVISEVNATNCRNGCSKDSGKHADDDRALAEMCANASDIRSKQLACYSATSACNVGATAQCLLRASECVFK
jgi:hypothetical protein